ncbi:mitochondrial carrier [Meira miltonrushii]|uniref:Mitochondrial carrier n=1 Tax=Meira miltonrushii TaxID=1280837 RepID=A0A316V7D9_9BASI|nr:mitochondrial carrier [Meira miltonrushii]PWN33529.1 mitochondrial carrier [Meira miltonrushii]
MVNDSFIHACAGGAGGVLAMTATYPIMTISTRAAVETRKDPEKSLIEAAGRIVQEEGVSGLYSGLNSSLIGVGVSNFVYYFFFEKCRDVILTSKNRLAAANAATEGAKIAAGGALTTLESMLAGAIAGSATTCISNPIWVINTRQTIRTQQPAPSKQGGQVQKTKKLSFFETIAHVKKTDGITAFWKGLGPALVLVINPILQYTAYEQLRALVLDGKRKRGAIARLSDIEVFLLGALSKLFATGLTYPQIVIKSRQQSGGKGSSNVWTAMTDIVNREGLKGLYKGIFTKLIQSVLTAALLFASKERIYEITKKALVPVAAAAAQAPGVKN